MAKFTQLFKEIQDNSITPIKTTFCGNLASLETTAKDNLVNAINEVKNSSGASSGITIDTAWEGESNITDPWEKTLSLSINLKDYKFIMMIINYSYVYNSRTYYGYNTPLISTKYMEIGKSVTSFVGNTLGSNYGVLQCFPKNSDTSEVSLVTRIASNKLDTTYKIIGVYGIK